MWTKRTQQICYPVNLISCDASSRKLGILTKAKPESTFSATDSNGCLPVSVCLSVCTCVHACVRHFHEVAHMSKIGQGGTVKKVKDVKAVTFDKLLLLKRNEKGTGALTCTSAAHRVKLASDTLHRISLKPSKSKTTSRNQVTIHTLGGEDKAVPCFYITPSAAIFQQFYLPCPLYQLSGLRLVIRLALATHSSVVSNPPEMGCALGAETLGAHWEYVGCISGVC